MQKSRTRISEELQEPIAQVVEEYARGRSYAGANAMFDDIANQMNNSDEMIRSAGNNAAIQTFRDLTPKVFLQFVQNVGSYAKLDAQMAQDFWGVFSEGNGVEMYNVLPSAPESTNSINGSNVFIPRGLSNLENQNWVINYFQSNGSLTPEAYAFAQMLSIQQISLLQAFRTGAGFDFLVKSALTIYESLRFYQYDKWAKTKFTLPSGNSVNGHNLVTTGTGNNAFECWKEISDIVEEMKLVNSHFNYNGSFKKAYDLAEDDVVIYCSMTTYNTLKRYVATQLPNNADFLKGLIDRVRPLASRKLVWLNATNATITIPTSPATTVNAGATISPISGVENIPAGLTWTSMSGENSGYIPDNQVWIMSKDAFAWIKQTQNTASQYFARNFSDNTMLYELGAMQYNPLGKVQVYQSNNINTNPTSVSVVSRS